MSDPTQVDPRGLRFNAAVTAIVLAVVLLTGSGWLLAVQAVVFGTGALAGLRYSPYGLAYRSLVARRLGPPAHCEPEAPPRFAQAVGLTFALIGVAGYLGGAGWLGYTATTFAWVAAFLNAAFGFCLGCETYLLFRRVVPTRSVRSVRKGVVA
jgi:Domain of unknown function (DUF4395)